MKINKLFAAIALGASMAAQAGVVDLFGQSGNFDQTTFGSSGSYYYAQSVKADAANWADLSFSLSKFGAGGTFNLLITDSVAGGLPGTGLRPNSANVLFSTELTHNGSGAQIFDVALNTSVVAGTTYFFVLQGFGETLADAAVLATEFGGTDKYANGEFIYSNSPSPFASIAAWESRYSLGQDLVFRAEFAGAASQVPEPGSLALLGLGLVGLAAARKRKQV